MNERKMPEGNEDKVEMTETEITRMQIHSSAGGKHACLQEAVAMLRTKSGAAFAQGRDSEAKIIRELANEFEVLRKNAEKVLDECIRQRQG